MRPCGDGCATFFLKIGCHTESTCKNCEFTGKNANDICTLYWCGLVDIIAVVVMMHLWRETRFILIKWNGNTHTNPHAFTRTPLHVCTSNWLHATLLIIHYHLRDVILGMLRRRVFKRILTIWMKERLNRKRGKKNTYSNGNGNSRKKNRVCWTFEC